MGNAASIAGAGGYEPFFKDEGSVVVGNGHLAKRSPQKGTPVGGLYTVGMVKAIKFKPITGPFYFGSCSKLKNPILTLGLGAPIAKKFCLKFLPLG